MIESLCQKDLNEAQRSQGMAYFKSLVHKVASQADYPKEEVKEEFTIEG
jgi:hypothetical protein